MYTEDDFIQLSALQHYVYCPRQCALIHVEDVWRDNLFTVRGELLHEKVDTDSYESRGALRTVRGLRIHSFELGLAGRCDVVEFHKSKEANGEDVIPVEYKAGEPKEDLSDKIQLCAQALCLEEMLKCSVRKAAFFYGKIRRRMHVEIDDALRGKTLEVIAAVHEIVASRQTPPAKYRAKCRNCSLEEQCMPKAMNSRKLSTYIEELYHP